MVDNETRGVPIALSPILPAGAPFRAAEAAVALALGAWLLRRSLASLRRRGAHTRAFWATLAGHARYRARALPSAGGALIGLVLLALGLYTGYLAVLAFYAERFGRVSG